MDLLYSYGIDIALAAIFIFAILDGRRKGLVKMVLNIAAFFISVFVAKTYFESIGTWVYDNWLEKAAMSYLVNKIESSGMAFNTAKITEFASALPDALSAIAEKFGTPVEEVLATVQQGNTTTQDIAQLLVDKILSGILHTAANVMSFAVVFVACYAVLSVVIGVVDKVFKLPVLKGINRWLGAALGAVKGAVTVVFITLIVCLIAGFMPESGLADAVDNSRIVKLVSEQEMLQDFEITRDEGVTI